MEADRKWIIVRIDGKIAAVSTDYRQLAEISARIVRETKEVLPYKDIRAEVLTFEEVWDLRSSVRWEDLMLFGTDFQKKVWRKLWDMTHGKISIPAEDEGETQCRQPELICYSDFAGLCNNRAGVRAVAHAIGLNPVAVIIPCHLVIPKEAIDKISVIHQKAESTIFKGDDLCLSSILSDNSIDFGEYALGRKLKRKLIQMEMA